MIPFLVYLQITEYVQARKCPNISNYSGLQTILIYHFPKRHLFFYNLCRKLSVVLVSQCWLSKGPGRGTSCWTPRTPRVELLTSAPRPRPRPRPVLPCALLAPRAASRHGYPSEGKTQPLPGSPRCGCVWRGDWGAGGSQRPLRQLECGAVPVAVCLLHFSRDPLSNPGRQIVSAPCRWGIQQLEHGHSPKAT